MVSDLSHVALPRRKNKQTKHAGRDMSFCCRTATVKALIDAGVWGANGHNFKQARVAKHLSIFLGASQWKVLQGDGSPNGLS